VQSERLPGSRQVRLWGTIPLRSPSEQMILAVNDPAEYAALALRYALEERGVEVMGSVSARHRFPSEQAENLEQQGSELARIDSEPLIEDLKITAKVSQNLHAELALRAVGRERKQAGTRQAGLEELKSFLGDMGISPDAYNFRDGSGLDRADLVSPSAVIQLLRQMYSSPARQDWLGILPVGGVDGTLNARFAGSDAAGRIHAKTGTLSHVSTLSGYAERRDGTWVAFSILSNNYNGSAAEVRGIIDRICTLIVEE